MPMDAVLEQEISQKLSQQYIPLSEVQELLSNIIEVPYKTRFSLGPYMDVMKTHMYSACDHTKSAIMPLLSENQKAIDEDQMTSEMMLQSEEFQTIIRLAVPSLMFSNELSYIATPFKKTFHIKTPAFEKMWADDEWELKIIPEEMIKSFHKTVNQAGIHILNTLYGESIPTDVEDIITIRNKNSGIEKFYRINVKFDFINVKPIGDLPELSKSQINYMLRHSDDCELWLKYLPTDKFEFEGFAVGTLYDITDIQVISALKDWMSYSIDLKPDEFMSKLQHTINSFLGVDSVKVGALMLIEDPLYSEGNNSLTGKNNIEDLRIAPGSDEPKGIYDHIFTNKKVSYIEDLTLLENPSKAEKRLIKKSYKSFVLAPLVDHDDQVISMIELGSEKIGLFNSMTVRKLQEIFDLLKVGFEKFSDEVNNRISGIIQKNFTSIHQSVEWKFEEVSKEYFRLKQEGAEDLSFSPIIFKDVYPLYGQSDIVGSSTQRNKNIQLDLIDNLESVLKVIDQWDDIKKLHLLDSYKIKVEKLLHDLKEEFISTDESKIVNLITDEINPLLEKTLNRYQNLPRQYYEEYLAKLDPNLGIIYNHRKQFERSVSIMISHISDFMEKEESQMQKILPHYFEKYKTDGVEYNIYVGQSLLQNGEYTPDDLRNFRLWQLVNTCEISRLVKDCSSTLEVPLETAELIFVYNNSLSIRFRMDEKKFDVDGAYNVRYEILKKRIDKAIVKGTGERLTVAGKIAIVYLNAADKQQYLEFFEYLKAKGYIEDEIEDLELERLQGAEGLKALRIAVKY